MSYIIIENKNGAPYLYFRGTERECINKINDLDERAKSKGWSSFRTVGTFFVKTFHQCEKGQVRDYNSIRVYLTDSAQDIKTYFNIAV